MRASPDCSSSSSSSKLAGFSPSARPAARAPGGTGGSRAAPSWAGSPGAMDSDDEMVEEAVEGTNISLGPGEEAPRARNAEGVQGCDRRCAEPRGRHCTLHGWPGSGRGWTATATQPGARLERRGAGREAGSAATGSPVGHGGSIPPATACIPSWEFRNLPCTLPPFGDGRWGCAAGQCFENRGLRGAMPPPAFGNPDPLSRRQPFPSSGPCESP